MSTNKISVVHALQILKLKWHGKSICNKHGNKHRFAVNIIPATGLHRKDAKDNRKVA
jgi:hypothetical protein